MIIQRIRQFFTSLVLKERSSSKLALSFSMGVYIAFSPFIGFHTIMTILFSWLFRLNLAVTFAGSCLIHNPWTFVPIYSLDYVFGDWLFKTFLGLDTATFNPWWMSFINDPLRTYIGLSNVSFWAFMLGGNVLGIFFSIAMYPIFKRIFAKLVDEIHGVVEVQG